jgi:hypothetical protein
MIGIELILALPEDITMYNIRVFILLFFTILFSSQCSSRSGSSKTAATNTREFQCDVALLKHGISETDVFTGIAETASEACRKAKGKCEAQSNGFSDQCQVKGKAVEITSGESDKPSEFQCTVVLLKHGVSEVDRFTEIAESASKACSEAKSRCESRSNGLSDSCRVEGSATQI